MVLLIVAKNKAFLGLAPIKPRETLGSQRRWFGEASNFARLYSPKHTQFGPDLSYANEVWGGILVRFSNFCQIVLLVKFIDEAFSPYFVSAMFALPGIGHPDNQQDKPKPDGGNDPPTQLGPGGVVLIIHNC
jgi:hypothetical protein